MTYAAVITHVQADPRAAPRLDCALQIARRFHAALIGVSAETIPPLAFDNGLYSAEPEWTALMRDAIEQRAKDAKDRFRAATATLETQALWVRDLAFPSTAMAAASRAADLIVAGGAPREMHDGFADCSVAELALISGRPVLMAPPRAQVLAAKTIILAWKDSREARRALSDALPFLEQADQVIVTAVCPDDQADTAKAQVDDVAAALVRRNVKALANLVRKKHPTGFDLVEEARRFDADLIVSGAYGHSRLGEWVFGGVTNDLLAQTDVFVLFSH